MTKLRDGYFRQVDSKVGDDNYLLKAKGGYIGLHTGRNNEANKVVRTDEYGYIQAGWINTTSGGMDGSTPTRIYASYDGYIRYMTPAYFFSTLSNDSNQLSVTVGGQNRKLTVAYSSSAEAANYLNGYTKIVTVNGDINTYYPVKIPNSSRKSLINTISVWRNLGGLKSAIYPGSHGSYTTGNGGGVSCWYEFVGRYNGWDGNGGYYYTRRAWYAYDRQLSHAQAPGSAVGDLFVWLRGGGTEYYVSTNYPFSDPVVYYERTNASGSSQYPSWVEPRTDIGNEGIIPNTYYGNITGNANTASGLSVTHYWANIAISTNSNTATAPTFGKVYISGAYPHIDMTSTSAESSIYFRPSSGTSWAIGKAPWGVSGFGIGILNDGCKLTILDNGNTGIGTTSPGHKLVVNGNFSSSNYQIYGSASGTNCNSATYTGIWYYSSNGPVTQQGASTSDGALWTEAYSDSWIGQIAQDYRNGTLFTRSRNSGTWTRWKTIAPADSDFEMAPIANIVYNPYGRKFTKFAGTNGSWDTHAYSTVGYKECRLTYKIGQTNAYIMVGLNSDPTYNASYDSIDYCWYTQNGSGLCFYESGSSVSSISGHTSYSTGDEFVIEYSEGYVRYYHNGVLCREIARSYGTPLYFDSSFYNYGYIYDVVFEPIRGSMRVDLMSKVTDWNTVTTSIFKSSESSTTNAPTTGYIYGTTLRFHRDWTTYYTDLVVDLYNDKMFFRRKADGSFGSWRELLHSGNYTTWVYAKSDVYTKTESDNRFVNVTGDTMTGALNIKGNGSTRANLNLVSSGNFPNDLYFGSNNSSHWSISSRESEDPYIGLYNVSQGWAIKVNYGNNYVGIGTTAPSYKLDISGKTRSTDRIYSNEWIQFDNATGLYWPNHYGSHFYVNTSYTTYGNFVILGSKNSYAGINFGGSTSRMTLMDAGNDKGAYQENWGWLWYFNGANGKMHLRTSSNLGYDINLNGSVGSNSSFSGVGFVHTSYNSASYLLTSNGGVVNEGKYFKVAQAEPSGKSDYPWHLVAEFTQDNSSSQINTGIILLVKRFYSGTGAGILSIRCRYESGGSTPSFLHCNWILNDDLDSNSFVATCKRSGNIVTLRLYAYHVGWGIYTFQKLNESGWNMWENTWSLYNAHRGQSDYASYCFTTIPSGETQYVSTILTINNPVPWSGITGKPTSKTIWGQTYINASGEPQNVNGLCYITANGQTMTLGSQNGSWGHIETTAANFYFNKSAHFSGHVYPYSNASYDLGGSSNKWRYFYLNNRAYLDEWIQFSGSSGLYWPNTNGAHLYANTISSYGGLVTQGSRGGYCGLHLGPNTNYMTLMSTEEHQGLYNQNTGTWAFYYYRSGNAVGIRTSSITKNINFAGTTYISSNTWIGTTSGSEMLNVGGWVGTVGSTGWYNISYGGGIYMTDSDYVRTYNNKAFYVSNSGQHAIYTAGGFASARSSGNILSLYYNSTWYGDAIYNHGNGNMSIDAPGGSLYLSYNRGNTYFGGGTYYINRSGYFNGTSEYVSRATFGNASNGTHDANAITSNGLWYYSSNGPATSLGATTTDGALYSQAYSTSWVGQIAQDYRNGRLFVRGRNNGTWTSWLRVALYSEIPSSVSVDYTIWRDNSTSTDYKIQVVSVLPSSPNSNTFYVIV